MSYCAKTYCEIYREKRFCHTASSKEQNGVCDCRHAIFPCKTGILCPRAEECKTVSKMSREAIRVIRKRIAKEEHKNEQDRS